MVRSFSTAFTNIINGTSIDQYFVLEILWGSPVGTKYYLDRTLDTLTAEGDRCGSPLSSAIVTEWGQVSIGLRENQIGSTDSVTIKLFDVSGELRSDLDLYPSQQKRLRIYRMFDDDTIEFDLNPLALGDQEIVFEGTIKPFSWQEIDGVYSIQVDDKSKSFRKTVECIATQDIFPHVPEDYQDRNIPLCWGSFNRVEMICIERPFEFRTASAIERGATVPVINLREHPEDLNVLTGSENEYDLFIGTDPVTGYFTQSTEPETVPSTLTITSALSITSCTSTVSATYYFDEVRFGVLIPVDITPGYAQDDLDTRFPAGSEVMINQDGVWRTSTISEIVRDSPWQGAYRFSLSDLEINEAIRPGNPVRFIVPADANRGWGANALVRPQVGDWVYACNALPSERIRYVEGWGKTTDESGNTVDGFIVMGAQQGDFGSGSTLVENDELDAYTVNLDDDTWNLTGSGLELEGTEHDLKRNITTVTFKTSPRSVNTNLADNRLWATGEGVVDDSGSLIYNAAEVIRTYLLHPQLMAMEAEDVNSDSFDTVAESLGPRPVGFAQIDSADGMEVCQDIARQCKSTLLFDQGEVLMKMLTNSAPSSMPYYATEESIIAGTLAVDESSVDDLPTRISANWRYRYDDKTGNPRKVIVYNSNAETHFRRNVRDININLYSTRSYVVNELTFWLARWCRVYRTVRFQAFPKLLPLQPGDWMRLSYMQGFQSGGSELRSSWPTTPKLPYGGPSGVQLTYEPHMELSVVAIIGTQAVIACDTFQFKRSDINRDLDLLFYASVLYPEDTYVKITNVINGNAVITMPEVEGIEMEVGGSITGQFRTDLITSEEEPYPAAAVVHFRSLTGQPANHVPSAQDVGKQLLVQGLYSSGGILINNLWHLGTYEICHIVTTEETLDDGIPGVEPTNTAMVVAGSAYDPDDQPWQSTNGHSLWSIYESVLFNLQSVEIVETKDLMRSGLVEIVCRYPQFSF